MPSPGNSVIGGLFGVEFWVIRNVAVLGDNAFERFFRGDGAVFVVINIEQLLAVDLEEEVLVAVGVERRGRIG